MHPISEFLFDCWSLWTCLLRVKGTLQYAAQFKQELQQLEKCKHTKERAKRETDVPEKPIESISEWAILIGEQTIIPVSLNRKLGKLLRNTYLNCHVIESIVIVLIGA